MKTIRTTKVYKIDYQELKNKLGIEGTIDEIDYHKEWVHITATQE